MRSTTRPAGVTIRPGNGATEYSYQYGETSSYGSSSPVSLAAISPGEVVLAPQAISALRPGTTYHYRLIATNASGGSQGSDQTFTTAPPQPPLVSAGALSEVTTTAAA